MSGEAAPPGRELFVYYRVAEADVDAARRAAMAMQAGLCAAYPGLRARLLRRPGATDGRCTLMETYARPGGIDALVEASITQLAAVSLAAWQRGERHTEVFLPCA